MAETLKPAYFNGSASVDYTTFKVVGSKIIEVLPIVLENDSKDKASDELIVVGNSDTIIY